MDMKISAYRQSINDKPLSEGDIVTAQSVREGKNGSYILNINGKNVEALSKDILLNPPLKLQIIKANPLEVEIFRENTNMPFHTGDKLNVKILASMQNSFLVEINGKTYNAGFISAPHGSRFIAEVIKTEGLLLKEVQISPKLSALSLMAKEIMNFNQKEAALFLKESGASYLASFLSEDIKKFIRNNGQFFESKISKGISISDDAKLSLYTSQNSSAENALSKLQIANVLMGSDFFTFFENEELDFSDGIMRFSRNSKGSYSLFIKLNFTAIVTTIVSLIKHYENSYIITVRSKPNIAYELSNIRIKNCKIIWKELQDKDSEFFTIKKDNFTEMNGFERIG